MFIGGLDLRLRPYGIAAPTGPFGGHATLTDGLVSYWPLGEESGVRVDVHGSNDLTDNNTVGFASVTGPPNFPAGKAASFVAANSEDLSIAHANATDFIPTGAFTAAVWLKPSVLGTARYAYSKASTAATTGFSMRYDVGVNKWYAVIWGGGGGSASSTVPLIGRWDLVVFGYDGTNVFIQVNGAARVTSVSSAPSASANGAFSLGVFSDLSTGQYDGDMAHAAYWSRALSSQEAIDLYAAGVGLFYED